MLNAKIRDIPIPERMRGLPISAKGFPVPWFVAWLDHKGDLVPVGDGTPDFRCFAPGKVEGAHRRELCWICGQPRGRNMAFVVGPMCAVNRVSSEPPCHFACALYAAHACPFLTQPRMVRNEKGLPEERILLEDSLLHNPGVTLVWVTRSYRITSVKHGSLFRIGDPVDVSWWREGRRATHDEVKDAIENGLPELRRVMARDGLLDELPVMLEAITDLVPA